MIRRRRRKAMVQWLNVNTQSSFNVGVGPGTFVAGTVLNPAVINVLRDDNPYTEASAGSAYNPFVEFAAQGALKLRRIAGKIFVTKKCAGDTNTAYDQYPAMRVRASLVVMSTDASGIPQNIDQYATGTADYGLFYENGQVRRRYLWTREWILGHRNMEPGTFQSGTGGDYAAYFDFPESNANYGSVLDGPHVDWKGSAIINQRERLFWLVEAQVLDLTRTILEGDYLVRVNPFVRVLASRARDTKRY